MTIIRRCVEFVRLWGGCCFGLVGHAPGPLGLKIGTKLAWDLAGIIVS